MSGETERTDVLVVGGGPAGAACAIGLARAGLRPLLVEREAGPHDTVCGEFVSGEACAMLHALGMDAVTDGAPIIDRLLLATGRREARARLPFSAIGLTRRRLDEALLQRAGEAGARVRRGFAVRGLARADGGWQARLADGALVTARLVVLAAGKHDLRGHARPRPADADLVGFKTHLALAPPADRALSSRIGLFLYEGGYAGMQRVEGGRVDLCLVAREALVREVGGGLDGLLARLLPRERVLADLLDGARPAGEKPLAIARIPYGFVHRPGPQDPPDLYRVGDQAGVVPSFCGDGLAIALHTGLRAAQAIVAGEGAPTHHARIAAEIGPQIARARLVERLGRSGLGRAALVAAVGAAPSLAALAARATRVPERAWRAAVAGTVDLTRPP